MKLYDKNKNSKFPFYMKGIFNMLLPHFYYEKKRDKLREKYKRNEEVIRRVDYYNKTNVFKLDDGAMSINEFYKTPKKTYFFDLLKYLKYFDKKLKISFLFGDIRDVPSVPSIVKSRPIIEKNENSILMKLNSVRHFIFVKDEVFFKDKLPLAVWRGKCHQKHRVVFIKQYFDKEFCNVGQVNTKGDCDVPWQKEKLSLEEQLKYRFLIAIEGNDVASNLKWAMSSNSLVLMSKPKYETWFMEGLLEENRHYVLLKDDYSDLKEKIDYYNVHVEEAQNIINNAHNHIAMFLDEEKETAISLWVLEKYFKNSQQL